MVTAPGACVRGPVAGEGVTWRRGGRGGAATPTCEASEPQRASASQMCSSRHIPVLRVDSVPELSAFLHGAGRGTAWSDGGALSTGRLAHCGTAAFLRDVTRRSGQRQRRIWPCEP